MGKGREAVRALLRVRGLYKSYAAPVLKDVDLEVLSGEVHALVGANGAGKSTLARIICGLTALDGGQMTLEGQAYRPRTKTEAEAHGVQMVMQELNLVGTLSIAENLFLNRLPHRLGFLDYRRLHAQAREALAAVGLEDLDPALPVRSIGVGHQQLIEIAAALARPCRLLILDEPTAALTNPEIDLLFQHVRRLKAGGVGIIYISHRMEEILTVCDRVTVLRDGSVVDTRLTQGLSVDEIVQRMVGRDRAEAVEQGKRKPGSVALRVEGLYRGDLVRDVSFDVHQGEILGLAGLVGSGRTETLRTIFGADKAEAGIVRRGADAPPLHFRQPGDAVRAGIGMVPEDRKQHGLLLPLSIGINTTLSRLQLVSRSGGWIDKAREHATATRLNDQLAVHRLSVRQPVQELSGGNQQKVVLARWLLRDCDVLLFDEPTRGIDVEARQTVYQLLNELALQGKAIVVVSSELRELMAICDRIAVLSAGRLAATFSRDEWTEEGIMAASFSGYLSAADKIHT